MIARTTGLPRPSRAVTVTSTGVVELISGWSITTTAVPDGEAGDLPDLQICAMQACTTMVSGALFGKPLTVTVTPFGASPTVPHPPVIREQALRTAVVAISTSRRREAWRDTAHGGAFLAHTRGSGPEALLNLHIEGRRHGPLTLNR